jgi:serine/threonine protein kinase
MKMHTKAGTPYYMAPEVVGSEFGGYTSLCDMWSAGVMLYAFLVGYPPFYGEKEQVFEQVRRFEFDFDTDDWSKVSIESLRLVEKLMVKESKRMTAV